MTHGRKLLGVVTAGLATAACGPDYMYDPDLHALDQNIGAARQEAARHQDAVSAMNVLAVLPGEVERHERQMESVVNAMDANMNGITSRCVGPGIGTMYDGIDSMDSEMGSYRTEMAHVASLVDARSQCNAHTRRVDGVLDDMQQALGAVGCALIRIHR